MSCDQTIMQETKLSDVTFSGKDFFLIFVRSYFNFSCLFIKLILLFEVPYIFKIKVQYFLTLG